MNFQVLFQTSGPLASSRSCFPREESVRIDRERAAQEALRPGGSVSDGWSGSVGGLDGWTLGGPGLKEESKSNTGLYR